MAQAKKTTGEMKLSTAAAILGVISLILFAVLSRDGENASGSLWTYVALAAGVILQVVSIALYEKLAKNTLVLAVIRFLQTVCYVLALATFILGRVNWLFRIMSKMSAAPLTALFPAVIVAFVVTILVHVISTYMSYEK